MNNLKEKLRALREIKPGQEFTNRSKLEIFATPQESHTITWKQFILGVVEYGGALALAAVLFVVIAGNTPLGKVLAPFDAGSLNSANLRAEAEAIDIQIELLDIDTFAENASSLRTSTPATSSKKTTISASKISLKKETTTIATTEEESETSTLVSPDEALLFLIQ